MNSKVFKSLNSFRKLFPFIKVNWLTLFLIVLTFSLIKYIFVDARLLQTLIDRNNQIELKVQEINKLTQLNSEIKLKLENSKEKDLEIIESNARYRFRMIKPDEIFFQLPSKIQSEK